MQGYEGELFSGWIRVSRTVVTIRGYEPWDLRGVRRRGRGYYVIHVYEDKEVGRGISDYIDSRKR